MREEDLVIAGIFAAMAAVNTVFPLIVTYMCLSLSGAVVFISMHQSGDY